jgi:hypothetical protein
VKVTGSLLISTCELALPATIVLPEISSRQMTKSTLNQMYITYYYGTYINTGNALDTAPWLTGCSSGETITASITHATAPTAQRYIGITGSKDVNGVTASPVYTLTADSAGDAWPTEYQSSSSGAATATNGNVYVMNKVTIQKELSNEPTSAEYAGNSTNTATITFGYQ